MTRIIAIAAFIVILPMIALTVAYPAVEAIARGALVLLGLRP